MRAADIKTDGTLYRAQLQFSLSRDRVPSSSLALVKVLDLKSPDARLPRYGDERKPVKVQIVEPGAKWDPKAGAVTHTSTRRILFTEAEYQRRLAAAELARAEAERAVAERLESNAPLVERLNAKQVALGLVAETYQGVLPVFEYRLDERGHVRIYDHRPRIEKYEQILDQLERVGEGDRS